MKNHVSSVPAEKTLDKTVTRGEQLASIQRFGSRRLKFRMLDGKRRQQSLHQGLLSFRRTMKTKR